MQVLKFKHIDKIVDAINTNKACVVETDTVMGVLAKDPKIIYELKKRDQAKKLILFIPSRKQVTGLSSEHNALINQFWPGQLTIIFKGVGYRLPNHPKLIKIIEKTGPLYSSSANLSGNEPVKNWRVAKKLWDAYGDRVIVVKGKTVSSSPSTIIDLDKNQIVREGVIPTSEIAKVYPLINQKKD